MSPGLPEGVRAKVELEMTNYVHLFTHLLTGSNSVYSCTQDWNW